MAEVIKFKKPNIEETFMESLNDYQLGLFEQIMELIQEDFFKMQDQIDTLETALVKKCAECEMLKLNKGKTK